MNRHHWFHHHHLHSHMERLREAGRHGRHFGGFDDDDGFFGGHHGGHGGGRFGFGRVFGHGDLKLLLLALISERPSHGYELIRTIEDKFNGAYAPSPGTVYPTLSLLEDMGHASVEASDGRKLYSITDQGRTFLDDNREAVEAVKERMESVANLRSRMAVPRALREPIRELKRALFMHGGPWTDAEVERVRAILARAADDISNRGDGD